MVVHGVGSRTTFVDDELDQLGRRIDDDYDYSEADRLKGEIWFAAGGRGRFGASGRRRAATMSYVGDRSGNSNRPAGSDHGAWSRAIVLRMNASQPLPDRAGSKRGRVWTLRHFSKTSGR